jgi:hypothetical protein
LPQSATIIPTNPIAAAAAPERAVGIAAAAAEAVLLLGARRLDAAPLATLLVTPVGAEVIVDPALFVAVLEDC